MSHRYRIAFRETLCGGKHRGYGLSRDAQSSIRDTMGSEYDTRRRSSRQSLSESRRRSSRQIRCNGDNLPQNNFPLINQLNDESPVNLERHHVFQCYLLTLSICYSLNQ